MDGVLSQEEINALLNDDSGSDSSDTNDRLLTDEEKDAIGEIANISMGTAATTLLRPSRWNWGTRSWAKLRIISVLTTTSFSAIWWYTIPAIRRITAATTIWRGRA